MGEPNPSPIVIGDVSYEDYSQVPVTLIECHKLIPIVQNIVSESSFIVVPSLLQILNTEDRLEVIHALVDMALISGQTKKLLDWCITLALEECTDPELVLRENSLASLVIQYYVNSVALSDLVKIIKPSLEALNDTKTDLTVSRTRIVDNKTRSRYNSQEELSRIETNKQSLINHAQSICDQITSDESRSTFKTSIGYLMCSLKDRLKERFNNEDITWNALTNVFYLRFVFGTLSNVRRWKREVYITKNNPLTSGNVGKVTKILNQSVGLDFDEHNEFQIFNEFLHEIRPKFTKFLDDITSEWNAKKISTIDLTTKQITRRISTILDYFTKSRAGAFEEFSRQLTDITIRLMANKKPFDQQSLSMAYMQLNSIFLQKQEIRTFLLAQHASEGSVPQRFVRRVRGKRSSSKELRQLAAHMNAVKKQGFEGEESYSYDAKATLLKFSEGKSFVVLVFYRGYWCKYCAKYMSEWNDYLESIVSSGGCIVAVSSQSFQMSEKTRKDWKLNYGLIGDPENVLGNDFGVSITTGGVEGTDYTAMNSAHYPWGLVQPAVIAYDTDSGEIFFSWKSIPKRENQYGGKERVPVASSARQIIALKHSLKRSESTSSLEWSAETSASDTDSDSYDEPPAPSLHKRDVEFDNAIIAVKRQLNKFPEQKAKMLVSVLTKEDKNLAEEVVKLLKKHKTYKKLFNPVSVEECVDGCDIPKTKTEVYRKKKSKDSHRQSHKKKKSSKKAKKPTE